MRLPRSTFYDAPSLAADDAYVLCLIQVICDEFETHGCRRVGAALRQQGIVVNAKNVRRLMREHDLEPRRRRLFVATTDSAHDLPVFPNLAPEVVPDGPNQLRNGDITYVAVAAGFVYVALILDAWSRCVVGYAVGRSIERDSPEPRSTPRSPHGGHRQAAWATRTRDRSTRRRVTSSCSTSTGWSAR